MNSDERIKQIVAELGEHFDAVQVMLSVTENGSTRLRQLGVGNWYARQGMAHEFINSDISADAAMQIAQRLKDD